MGGKSASRFSDYHQICQSANLANLCNLCQSVHLPGGISASRFSDCHKICQWKLGGNLLADLVTVTKSASRNGGVNLPVHLVTITKSASQQIWQIYAISASQYISQGGISASRFSDCHKICQWKLGGGESAGRFGNSH